MTAITFELTRYCPSRRQKGLEAAEYLVEEDGESYYIWMSEVDIRHNIMRFGRHDELLKGVDAYKNNKILWDIKEKA